MGSKIRGSAVLICGAMLFGIACGDAPATTGSGAPAQGMPNFAPGAYVVALSVDGPEAELSKAQRCQAVLERYGIVVRADANILVQMTLTDSKNFVRIFRRYSAQNFQPLRQSQKPDWSMGELCKDLVKEIHAALSGAAQPGVAQVEPPPPGYYGPPPGQAPQPQAPQPQAPPPSAAPPQLELLPSVSQLPPAAAQRAQAGAQLFAKGDFANALGAFAEAHRTSGDSSLLFNTGLCYVRLHRNVEALQYLQLFLDRAPSAPNRAAVEAQIHELRRQQGDDD